MSKPKIAIVFYSLYGHVYSIAQSIAKGVEAAGGEAQLYQCAETLPDEVLKKMHAPPKPDVPIATPDVLAAADGVLFGISARYGSHPTQMRALWDATGQVWAKGGLVGKPGGIFTSTGNLGGGQETAALTAIPFFTHHGMIFVPMGYTHPKTFDNTEVHGGSPYGPGVIAGGDGSRQASPLEHELATHFGQHFTKTAHALLKGRAA